jgi:hypothetical protein
MVADHAPLADTGVQVVGVGIHQTVDKFRDILKGVIAASLRRSAVR